MMKFFADALLYLFIPYFSWGFFDISQDKTLPQNIKDIGYIINALSIIFILMTIIMPPKYLGFFYFLLGSSLFLWYASYTFIDVNNKGYTDLQRYIYVCVDVLMAICICGGSMFFTYLAKYVSAGNVVDLGNHLQIIYNSM